MYRVFLIVVVLIVYGSLYPWHFHSTQLAASPLWVLIHSWPTRIDRILVLDIALNLLIYLPVGVFGYLALRQNCSAAIAVTLAVLFALVLSSGIEMTQLFDDSRECTASDVVCNVGGAMIGVAMGSLYQHWLKRVLARAETSKLLRPSGAVLLSYTWLAYQVFPLMPALSRTMLAEKIRILLAEISVSPIDTFTCLVEWLVAAQLIESVLGEPRTRRLLPLFMLVLPARMLILGRTVTWSELDGAVLAFLCFYLLSGIRRRAALVGGLLVSMLIVNGLAPYHWSGMANPFSWVPFGGFLAGDQEFGILIFLRKCFWYGSTIWLLREASWRLTKAVAAVTMLLSVIEVIQIHLPGRVAEVTDPLLALILGVILGLLDRSQSLHSAS